MGLLQFPRPVGNALSDPADALEVLVIVGAGTRHEVGGLPGSRLDAPAQRLDQAAVVGSTRRLDAEHLLDLEANAWAAGFDPRQNLTNLGPHRVRALFEQIAAVDDELALVGDAGGRESLASAITGCAEPLDHLAAGDRVHVDRGPARSFRYHGQLGDQVSDRLAESERHLGRGVDRRDAEKGHRTVGDAAPRHDPEPENAAVADADPRRTERLGDDHVVRRAAGDPADLSQVGDASVAAAFFVDRAADLERSTQADAAAPHRFGGEHRGGDAGLHVGRAAAVEPAVPDLAAERVDRPAVSRRHHVDVPVQVQGRSRAPAPAQAEHVDLGTLRIAAGTLDVLGLETVRFEPYAEQLRALPVGVAGRVDRWHADQFRCEEGRFLAADRSLGENAVHET